ncbi:hypothetical protein DMJ13_17790 [halophilic archaeon]|nr:hypothetical protein DMJ13_17790 [halophilic archaeon]
MVDNSRRTALKVVGGGTIAGLSVGTQSAGAHETNCGEKKRKKKRTVFSAGKLSGAQEVPPVETSGQGAAVFKLSDHGDGPHIHYALLVATIKNVTQAHIHLGQKGENGPIVAFLFGKKNKEGEFSSALEQGVTENGVLATGTITAEDLVGPLAGKSLSNLVEAMRAGSTYVNVHTEQNPPGEIRGQIQPVKSVDVDFKEKVDIAAKTESKLHINERVKLHVDEDHY